MNKKPLWLIFIISLIITLPAFSGQATISPEDAADLTRTGIEDGNDNLTANDFSGNYDGNTVDIIETDNANTVVLLNDTYQLEIHHNDTNVGVRATQLEAAPLLGIQADTFLFDVDFTISPSGKFLDVELPTTRIKFEQAPYADDVWNININDEVLYITTNTTEKTIGIDYMATNHIDIGGDEIYYTDSSNAANNFVLTRIAEDEFLLITPDGLFDVFLNSTHVLVDWVGNLLVQPMGPHIPFQWSGIAPMVSISFVDHCVMVEWEDVTVQILEDVVIMIIDFIIITWYFFFAMITIIIYDLTIIFYLTVIELLLVIIYYTFEIKIYETQVVMVYEMIEIIFLFVAIFIWQITFIFHFEFWFIQLIFIIDLVAFIIINQVRIIFIPVIIPVFIPVVYYVPVIMKEYVHIYVPYAAEQLFIEIVGQELQKPTHTMSYRVLDQLGNPILDATVNVDYNGTVYPATHMGGGQYDVALPASDEEETITVTASKMWYPTATLTYDLEVTWITETINVTTTLTAPSPLPVISVLVSLFAVSLAAMVINKKKKK